MIYLRDAVQSDMDLLFEWANDPIVRKNSFNTLQIPYEMHQKWFEHVMNSKAIHLFILMDDATPVGQIRLNVEQEEAEISYSISHLYRGKGYGKMIIKLIKEEVCSHYPKIKRLVAKVKTDNDISNRLFASAGFDKKYICYTLDVNE